MFSRAFSTSNSLLQLPTHPLYPDIDWNKVGGGYYAVVDPMDSLGILYLTEKEYKIQVRVSVSQDSVLAVLARPGDTRRPANSASATSTSSILKPNSPTLKRELGLVSRKRDRVQGTLPFLGWFISRLSKAVDDETLVTPTSKILLSLAVHWGKDLNLRSGGQLEPTPTFAKALAEFGVRLGRISSGRGHAALISKMKNSLFFVLKYLSGTKPTDPFLLGEPVGLARSGLPKILPLYFRRAIASGNIKVTRVVISLLKAYSAFSGPHQDSDLSSVTGECPPLDEKVLKEFSTFCLKVFWPQVVQSYALKSGVENILEPKLAAGPRDKPFYPQRGGPNHPVGVLGAPMDALAWSLAPRNYVMEWCHHVKDIKTRTLFQQTLHLTQVAHSASGPHDAKWLRVKHWDFRRQADLGRLALLPEAAGKVRTIAIVDYWTQRLMKPVHDWMMEVLSCLPADATFNQDQALKSYAKETEGVKLHWSIDLKSATDMIPIELYYTLFKGVWGAKTAMLWRALLTDRAFRVPKASEDFIPLVIPRLRGTLVEYARGQPMGTLSSWPSMALVHHALVLFAAQRVGRDPRTFTKYRVLGDDNVTGDDAVAQSYLQLCESLQIPISHSKTLSGKCFIFASQVYLGGTNLSPMSLKEELGIKTSSQRLEMAIRAVTRGWLDGKLTSCGLLRLLIRRRDYLRAVPEFKVGKLGRVAQAALISAFALLGNLLDRLGVGESSVIPYLLSFENKVRALGGDESNLDKGTRAYLRDVEVLLVLHTIKLIIRKVRADMESIRTAAHRWTFWVSCMANQGAIPLWTDPVTNVPSVPNWDDPQAKLPRGVKLPGELSWKTYSQAVWPVLQDYFGFYFYGQYVNTHQKYRPAYPFGKPSQPWLVLEGKDTYVPSSIRQNTKVLWKRMKEMKEAGTLAKLPIGNGGNLYRLTRPGPVNDIVDKAYSIEMAVMDIQDSVVKWDLDTPGVLNKIQEALEITATIPRFPTMDGLSSLVPDRSPKAADEAKSWVKSIGSYATVLTHMQLAKDFSVLDMPRHVSDSEEALLSTTGEFLLSLARKKVCPPHHAG